MAVLGEEFVWRFLVAVLGELFCIGSFVRSMGVLGDEFVWWFLARTFCMGGF